MPGRALMFQGTGSSVGKSTLVAGLARALVKRGLAVRPFKPQNMSNNASVTSDGGEIGRAQALQARACGAAPSVHMNPVLLKPQGTTGAQVVVQGRVIGAARARDYQSMKSDLLPAVLDSFNRLRTQADIVLVEGAGSAAEINLRRNDIANMGFARAAKVPVVLIGDIDRGGVIASLVGTSAVLDADDAAMVGGFIINRMRGDASLFADGMRMIEERTGWPALGLVPHLDAVRALPAEDSMDLAERTQARRPGARLRIAVPLLPCIANFDDMDPLAAEPDVDLQWVHSGAPLPRDVDLIILPGSKATLSDLATLRAEGWHIDIAAHARAGGYVLGLCGGYQMLGRRIADPDGIESAPDAADGLGLLDVETVLTGDKRLAAVGGTLLANGARIQGYEMHIGRTTGPAVDRPLIRFDDGRIDGAVSPAGRVFGSYVHGLFATEASRAAWLALFDASPASHAYETMVETALDALADHLERHVNVDRLLSLAR
jgi:adenosylcobyric acid synthase